MVAGLIEYGLRHRIIECSSGAGGNGSIMAEVVVEVDASTIVAAITRSSVEHLNLQPGDTVKVIVKSTEVMIAKAVTES